MVLHIWSIGVAVQNAIINMISNWVNASKRKRNRLTPLNERQICFLNPLHIVKSHIFDPLLIYFGCLDCIKPTSLSHLHETVRKKMANTSFSNLYIWSCIWILCLLTMTRKSGFTSELSGHSTLWTQRHLLEEIKRIFGQFKPGC